MKKKRVIILDVAGLQLEHLQRPAVIPNIAGLQARGVLTAMIPPFPALTLPVQATLTTGTPPAEHGVVANGFYLPNEYRVAFWEQAARLVERPRIWQRLKEKTPSITTASLFLQNILYADCDVIITPKPLHSDEGLIQWCYSKPAGFYEELSGTIGEFNLMHYWGPMASIGSSRWIASAAIETLKRREPDLMFVYLPHLDYNMQRLGPGHPDIVNDLALIDQEVGRIIMAVNDLGTMDETVFVVLSEYKFYNVDNDVPINRILRAHDLLNVRTIQGREYLDVELSPAFAMVDHQVAHLYIKTGYEKQVHDLLADTEGIAAVLDKRGKKEYGIDHPRAGELAAVAEKNRWFSYYWWDDRAKEPVFAAHVDIHSKPGYDPLELFIDRQTMTIPQDTSLIKGSHGYPPDEKEGHVPLIISSPVDLPPTVAAKQVPDLLERLFLTG